MDLRLHYFSSGPRRYDRHPLPVHCRQFWEFQAVIEGRIAPILESGPGAPRERTLWAFEPDCAHGWTGPNGGSGEIIVFHLPAPDAILRRVVRRSGGFLQVSLRDADLAWLIAQRDSLAVDWLRPSELTSLKVGHLLSGLSLLMLRESGFEPVVPSSGLNRERVEKALYWYRQNIGRNPPVEAVAQAVGVSAVHLRRLFQQELGRSPKTAFQEIRLEQARDLLADPRKTVEAAAAQFGFADASSFSRAFKQQFGHPPRRRGRGSVIPSLPDGL